MTARVYSCRFCGQTVEQAGAVVLDHRWRTPREDGTEFTAPTYMPFVEDWFGFQNPAARLAHPQCFADGEGTTAFVEAVARHDSNVRPLRKRPEASELVAVELTEAERDLLRCGLLQWWGPARCTQEMAQAMGFSTVAEMDAEVDRIRDELDSHTPLTRADWTRSLLATEVVFASDVIGAGVEWEIVSPLTDEQTIGILRGLQRKLMKAGVVMVPGYRQVH